jgi:hypothetical protein
MRPVRAILPALLTCALLAGCGGGGDDDRFSSDFKPVNDELLQLRTSIAQAPSGSDAMLAGAFSGFAGQYRAIDKRIDALKPPKDLEPRVRVLSAAVAELIVDLERVSRSAGAGDAAASRAGTQALVGDLKAAESARRALAKETGARVGQ